MYSGAGATPLVAAATAWSQLAAELGSTAASVQSVTTGLTGSTWRGPGSAAMSAAAAPYVAWLQGAAAQAEQSATQASAAAAAFEAAFAATVPPAVIAANRALLAALVATNILGQNVPAIAATEAHYVEMWAQDAAAMYGYAAASSTASTLTPFTSPPQATNPGGLAAQSAAVAQATTGSTQSGLSQLLAGVPTTLQSMSAPVSSSSSSGLSGLLSNIFGSSTVTDSVNGMVNSGFWNGTSTISTALGFLSSLGSSLGSSSNAATGALGSAVTGGLGSGVLGLTGSTGAAGLGSGMSVGLGQAGTVGALSVPPSWPAAAPAVNPAAATLTSTGSLANGSMSAVPAGMPMTGLAGRADTVGPPRYGFRPTVVAHPPAAG